MNQVPKGLVTGYIDRSEVPSGAESRYGTIQVKGKGGVRREDLLDVPWSPPTKKTKGRPKKEANLKLAIKCKHRATGKAFYRCAADDCNHIRFGHPQSHRVLKHAVQCRKLPPTLRDQALEWSAAESLSSQLEAAAAKSSPGPDKASTSTSNAGSSGQQISLQTDLAREATTSAKEPQVKKGGLGEIAVAVGREELRKKVNFHIVKLICVRGLIPTILDTDEWKKFVEDLNPRYEPTSSTTFVEKYIPSEAAQVRVLQLAVLKTLDNLTLTFDGGSTRKPQSVYTVHITTPDRRVFFVEGDEASREHHTAEYVKGVIMQVKS